MVSDAMAQWVFEKSHYHGTGHEEELEMSVVSLDIDDKRPFSMVFYMTWRLDTTSKNSISKLYAYNGNFSDFF